MPDDAPPLTPDLRANVARWALTSEVGRRLRSVRRLRDLSQRELSDATHVAPSMLSRYESGVQAPSVVNLLRLADALRVPVDYLLGRDTPLSAQPPDRMAVQLGQLTASELALVTDFIDVLIARR